MKFMKSENIQIVEPLKQKYQIKVVVLENELKKDDISILSPPIKATYDRPFTLPMNRRNEAMFEINIKNKGET